MKMRRSFLCLVTLGATWSGCADHEVAMSSSVVTETKAQRWMELRTRFHRYDSIAGNDKFRDYKIQFVALLEFLMWSGQRTEHAAYDGMEFFFPAFDKALENVKQGTGGGITYSMFMDSVGAIQIHMNELVEHLSIDLSENVDHWRSLSTRKRIDALRGALLTDASMYLLLAGGSENVRLLAKRTRLYPVSRRNRLRRYDNRFDFHGTGHFTTMMQICLLSNDVLKSPAKKCLGLVFRGFHTYYTDRVLRTQNAPVIDRPDELLDFYGQELSFQQAIEGYEQRRCTITPEIAPVFLTAMELLVEPIPVGEKKLTVLAEANQKINSFVASQWAQQS
jgi:hypothetical protein